MPALNPRQLKFIELYLSGRTAADAYSRAGYAAVGKSAKSAGSRLLEHPGVKAAVEAARADANRRLGITAEWYARRVKREAERVGKGSSHAARVSALKLAGDLLGVWEQHKHEHSGPGGHPIQAEHEHRLSLSAADLDALEALVGAAAGT